MKEIIDELIELKITIKSQGEQLKIEGPKEKLTPDIVNKIRLNKQLLLDYLNMAKSKEYLIKDIPVVASDLDEGYVLSSSQKRVWLLSKLHEVKGTFYNLSTIFSFKGDLKREALQDSLNMLIKKHEILRTIFIKNSKGEIRQNILPFKETLYQINFYDFTEEQNKEEKIKQFLHESVDVTFDLTKAPLLQVKLLKTGSDDYILSFVMHHIISDGWSQDIIIKEILQHYSDYTLGKPSKNSPLRIQYKDYAQWQYSLKENNGLNESKEYWLNQLSGELPVLNLPFDFQHPPLRTGKGGKVTSRFDKEQSLKIKTITKESGATLFVGLLSLVKMLFFRYDNQKDLIIGIPVAGREHHDLEDQIGLYVNLLAIRTKITGKESFKDLLRIVKNKTLESYQNQVYPFDELIDILKPQRNISKNPLFDITVALKNKNELDSNDFLDNLSVKEYKDIDIVISRYDLSFSFAEEGDEILIVIEYNADVFRRETIERFLIHMKELLYSALSDPDKEFVKLDFLSGVERKNILELFNETAVDFPYQNTLTVLDDVVSKFPDHIAVQDEIQEMTYQELNAASEAIARYFIEILQLKPEDKVGVFMDKSVEAIALIIGILKANLVYVPFNPNDATERINYIIDDSAVKLMCTDQKNRERFSKIAKRGYDIHTIAIDIEMISKLPPSKKYPRPETTALAYIIYTSGSTGHPKGVMVGHEGLVNISFDHRDRLPIHVEDNVLQFIPFSFDGSVLDIFMTLLSGATLVLPNDKVLGDKDLFAGFMLDKNVTIASFTPSFLRFLSKDELPGVKIIVSAGETIDFETVKYYHDKGKIFYNAYGPTEATVNTTLYQIADADLLSNGPIPIGKPSANKKIAILDENMQLLPQGVQGEICIWGNGLAKGYLNNPELTSEKFTTNPFENNGKIYKTGDLGIWLPDGTIVYKGRKDSQIKIRGYRVELGEIESSLDSYEVIEKSVVLDRMNKNGEKELVAYYIPNEEAGYTIGKIIDFKKEKRADEINLFELPNGFTLFANTESELKIIYHEVVEDKAYLKNGIHVPDGGCVLDVGANIGLFSIHINSIAKDLDIYAFEPLPVTFKYLKQNASLYKGNIKVFNFGLSDKEETAKFLYYPHITAMSSRYIDKDLGKQTVKDFVLSAPEFNKEEINELMLNALIEERLVSEEFECHLKTISQVIKDNKISKIDLLKIDVEQAELDVINGINDTDWAIIQQVIIEVHDVEDRLNTIVSRLKAFGFDIITEQCSYLSSTNMYNIFARKPKAANVFSQENTLLDRGHLYGLNAFQDHLKGYLAEHLPFYMIPMYFKEIKEFPLINGKIDRKKLAENDSVLETETVYFPPSTELDRDLIKIWKYMLNLEESRISMKDNFFNIGGNSLSAMRVVGKIHEQQGIEIDLSEFFKNPTIEFLSNLIEKEKKIKDKKTI